MAAQIVRLPRASGEPDYRALARVARELGPRLRAAEAEVREALLEALDRGDVAGARVLIERWTQEPITRIAAGL